MSKPLKMWIVVRKPDAPLKNAVDGATFSFTEEKAWSRFCCPTMIQEGYTRENLEAEGVKAVQVEIKEAEMPASSISTRQPADLRSLARKAVESMGDIFADEIDSGEFPMDIAEKQIEKVLFELVKLNEAPMRTAMNIASELGRED